MAIAAKYRCNLFKSDTKQAFLNGDISEEKIYVRPLDWWPEHVPHVCAAIDEDYVWYPAGGSTIARADLNLDGGTWVPCYQ